MAKRLMLVGEPMQLFTAVSEGALEDVESYTCATAGAELNVAIGMARLGHPVSYLTKLGRDPFGNYIVKQMARDGIGTELVQWSKTRPTGFMLKSRVAVGDPQTQYFRKGSAASTISPSTLRSVDFSAYNWLHLTGILPALSKSALEASQYLIDKATKLGLQISFDPNLRPSLWKSKQVMVDTINRLAAQSQIVLPGIAEGELLTGFAKPEEIAHFYHRMGVETVIVKLGANGAYLSGRTMQRWVAGVPVKQIVDTVGAGDGFAVGVISALLEGLPLEKAVRRANAIGAIQVGCAGDNDGLPTRGELEHFIENSEKRDETDAC